MRDGARDEPISFAMKIEVVVLSAITIAMVVSMVTTIINLF